MKNELSVGFIIALSSKFLNEKIKVRDIISLVALWDARKDAASTIDIPYMKKILERKEKEVMKK